MAAMIVDVATVNGINLHYRLTGEGPLVVLLHGWPQTSHCWRSIVPTLAETHTVLTPDLRGYGHTDKPATGYDKRTMATDVSALVETLGFAQAKVIGHDRGARVAHRWALDHPDQVTRLVLLDIIPTREMWLRMDADLARRCFHWLFHLQPDLPERLAGSDIPGYLGYFFDKWAVNRRGLPPSAIDEYIRAFSAPGALRASLDDYRAADLDSTHDNASYGQLLRMPLLALWGSESFLRNLPALDIWRDYADDVRGQPIPNCGHFIAEERPAELLAHLTDFL
jgi:pimeloyl-ACP methyl ester carboxylesterase